jgi:hypothetical protein
MVTLQITDSKKHERTLRISGFTKPSGAKVAKVVNDQDEPYFVQILANGTTTCRHANNNEECKGHKYTGHCYHVDAVKVASLPSFEEVTAQPVVNTLEQIAAGIEHYKSVIAAWDAACEETTSAELIAAVNTELAKVNVETATVEEVAATQKTLLRPNDPDQIAYFLQLSRRAAVIKSVPAPQSRKVSREWLIGQRSGGTFSGKVA